MKTEAVEEKIGINIALAERIKKLPPYLFVEIDKLKRKVMSEGKDVINLGIGDPDTPTPKHIIEELSKTVQDPANHQYAMGQGLPVFRESIARWYKKRFNVDLDPVTEILPLLGSKEGIAHIPLAFINTGDPVLIPEPAYPAYQSATILAGGIPHFMPLLEKNGFLPDLDEVDTQVARRSKLIFLNYPNNPTGVVADRGFFEKAVKFAQDHDTLICHDAAYTEMYFDGYKPISFLETPGAKEVGIEFHSLSKTYNMTGWRVGFAVGNKEAIAALSKVKSNIDSGMFQPLQYAGIAAMEGPQDEYEGFLKMYKERRDVMIDGLNRLGWKVQKPFATFYVWVPVPPGFTSSELTRLLLEKAAIVSTPGNGFGPSGEGYIRFALTVTKERIQEAILRIEQMHSEWK